VVVGWYLLATMRRLRLVDASGRPVEDAYTLATFDIER
jgi:hypothetical protein